MILEQSPNRKARQISVMHKTQALAALSALANEARLDLVRLLIANGDQGLAAGEIGRSLGLSASRLSFHLSALEAAGLIQSRKQARNVIYTAEVAGIGAMMSYLLNDCCMDHPEVLACCQHANGNRINSSPAAEKSAPDRSDQGS